VTHLKQNEGVYCNRRTGWVWTFLLLLRFVSNALLSDEIYDIRDAKERKRRANGPFIKPISYQTTELDTTVTYAPRTSQTPRSPTVASKSSTSLRAEPTLPSIHSSDHGPGFIPSQQSSPLLAEKGSPTSKSTTSKASWNPFLGATQTATPDVPFIPDSNQDVEFFTRSRSRDTDLDRRNEWKLFEERKKEDQGLLAELGWRSCSTSGISGSQSSQQDPASQSRDLISNVHGQHGQLDLEHWPMNGSRQPRFSTSEQARISTPLQMNKDVLNMQDVGPLSRSTETNGDRQSLEMKGPAVDEAGRDESNTFLMEDQVGQLSVVVHEVEHCLADQSVKATKKDIEDEDDDDDEGMPWF
jgi:hypothetical protein